MNHNDPKRGPSSRATQERRASRTAHTRNKRFELERKNGNLNISGFSNSEQVDPGVPQNALERKVEPKMVNKRNDIKGRGNRELFHQAILLQKFPFSKKCLKDKLTDEIKLGAKTRSNTTKIFSTSRINTSQVPAKRNRIL